MIIPPGIPDEGMSAAQVQQIIQEAAQANQLTINQPAAEGQMVDLPDTDQDITLNLQTVGAPLDAIEVRLPLGSSGRVGQRVFVNSDGEIAMASFTSTNPVNNAQYMFNPGDNCVYYRNQPDTWSRLTS